jgi:hypothetical protein
MQSGYICARSTQFIGVASTYRRMDVMCFLALQRAINNLQDMARQHEQKYAFVMIRQGQLE